MVCMAFTASNILDHNIRITVICGVICMIPTVIRLIRAFMIPLFLYFLIIFLEFLHAFGLAININTKEGYYTRSPTRYPQ